VFVFGAHVQLHNVQYFRGVFDSVFHAAFPCCITSYTLVFLLEVEGESASTHLQIRLDLWMESARMLPQLSSIPGLGYSMWTVVVYVS